MKSSFVLGMVYSLFSSVVFAKPYVTKMGTQTGVCFNTVADWQKVRLLLPKTMQSVPIYAVHQSWDLTGAAEIVVVGNTFRVDGRVQDIFVGDVSQSGIVSQACILGTQMKVSFTSGQAEKIDLTSTGITVYGYDFNTTNKQSYQSVLNSIN